MLVYNYGTTHWCTSIVQASASKMHSLVMCMHKKCAVKSCACTHMQHGSTHILSAVFMYRLRGHSYCSLSEVFMNNICWSQLLLAMLPSCCRCVDMEPCNLGCFVCGCTHTGKPYSYQARNPTGHACRRWHGVSLGLSVVFAECILGHTDGTRHNTAGVLWFRLPRKY